jgi:hypothetical protein
MSEEIKEMNPIEKAERILEEIKKANEESKVLIEMQMKMKAEQILSGKSEAGQVIKTETFDEKWAREAKLRYAGTGYDPT